MASNGQQRPPPTGHRQAIQQKPSVGRRKHAVLEPNLHQVQKKTMNFKVGMFLRRLSFQWNENAPIQFVDAMNCVLCPF